MSQTPTEPAKGAAQIALVTAPEPAPETAPKPKPPAPPAANPPPEFGGPSGPEPTRYGDWERNGRVSDF